MIYILDTDVLTLVELPDSPEYLRLHARVLQLDPTDILATTIITYEEQTRGWLAYAAKSRDTAHQIKAYNRLKKHLRAYLNFEVPWRKGTPGRNLSHGWGADGHGWESRFANFDEFVFSLNSRTRQRTVRARSHRALSRRAGTITGIKAVTTEEIFAKLGERSR